VKEKKFNWFKIAEALDEIQFAENNMAVIEVEGRKICIAKFLDQIFAFPHKCPHAGGILSDGFIDSHGNVVCPNHRYRYDLKNGRNVTGEGYYLKNWPVDINENGIYIGFEKGSGF
jgi:3-phenylpropionate/trans-cinnamate dioxygenase ferredoxin subunit